MIKVYPIHDEAYPVFWLDTEPHLSQDFSVAIEESEYEDYLRVQAEYVAWQDKISDYEVEADGLQREARGLPPMDTTPTLVEWE